MTNKFKKKEEEFFEVAENKTRSFYMKHIKNFLKELDPRLTKDEKENGITIYHYTCGGQFDKPAYVSLEYFKKDLLLWMSRPITISKLYDFELGDLSKIVGNLEEILKERRKND